jgi:hypothetical protein
MKPTKPNSDGWSGLYSGDQPTPDPDFTPLPTDGNEPHADCPDWLDRLMWYAENRGERITWYCLAVVVLYITIKTVFDIMNHYTPTL